MQVLSQPIEPPRKRFPDLPEALDAVVMKGLSRDPATRYATAREMAVDLEAALTPATPRELARWAEMLAGETLLARSQLVDRIEQSAATTPGEESGPAASGTKPVIPPGPAAKADPYAATFENLSPVDAPMPATTPRRRPGSAGPANRLESESGARPRALRPEVPLNSSERTLASADPGSDLLAPPAGGAQMPAPAPVRPRPIPLRIEPEEEPISLRDRIETPLKVIAAGVLLSVADPLLRPFLGGVPIRPLWVAEVLVVVGVLWVAARLVMPVRR
jgi:serine/threonine-protein kinase